MKSATVIVFIISLLVVTAASSAFQSDALQVWREFVQALKDNSLSLERIRPHSPLTKTSLMQSLQRFRARALWEEWETDPEVIAYAGHINFLISLKQQSAEAQTYCFTFQVEDKTWYFRHVEAIFIRLDKIGELPTSAFPDIVEDTKAWMRQELYWSKMVWLYTNRSKEVSKESALNMFLDGAGYFLAAKAWVPFVPPKKAFILFLCWEQANLRGNSVTLEKLGDDEAVVKLDPIFYRLYRHTGHLKTQIDFSDYRRIFETIWQDRAANAGWKLEISYRGVFSILRFTTS